MERRFRPSPAMVVACLALFVALGSGTYAAVKLKPNQVKTKNIKRKAVTGPKIAPNAVSAGKIAANAVTTPKIADSAVTEPKLAAQSVTKDKLGDGSVTKAKVAASGTAQNGGAYTLNNTCTLDTSFTAPGVQEGDTVAFSFSTTVPAGVLSVSPGEETAGNGVIRVEVCENAGVAANVTAGSLRLHWIAIR